MVNKFIAIVLIGLDVLLVSGRTSHGLIGYGISMYRPLCAYSCRAVLSTSMLNCSVPIDMSEGKNMDGSASTTPECYATDDAFLQTLAYCISTHCQDVAIWDLERYWIMNVAGTESKQPDPKATYQQTIGNITTKPQGILHSGDDLHRPMIVSHQDYDMNYNAQDVFEQVEDNHETFAIALIVSGSAIPIALSLLRFVPFPTMWSSQFNAWFIDPPLLGFRHKTPIAGLIHMPTRGQAFFIFYLLAINVIFSAAGINSKQPNAWYSSVSGSDGETVSYITNRVGVLSFANIALVFLYAGRNNVLLWLTDWSHGTFLLLHRWVAWIATLQAVLHSAIYLQIYLHDGTHSTESKLPYWVWGIVATLCMVILLPASILPIRKRIYDFFLAWHILLSVFVLAGCYWHILERFQRQWGYENWIYTAIAVWGFDRAIRFARLIRNGVKTAQVTIIDDDYVRVNIEDVSGSGHAYLYFPTLTWRVWENHPFSIASALLPSNERSDTLAHDENTKRLGSSRSSSDDDSRERHRQSPTKIGLTFLLRTEKGMTSHLRKHAALPVLVESAYGSHLDLTEYPLLICIVGGVGITACVQYLRAHPGATKLFWGVRSQSIVRDMGPSISGIEHEIYLERRMNIPEVLRNELNGSVGTAAVLVCGPTAIADEVRNVVSELGRSRSGTKVKLFEESFSW